VSERSTFNVCAIRRKSDGYFYEESMEHGAGWSERIRQAWTYREANIVIRKLFERGWEPLGSCETVELVPRTEASRSKRNLR